MRLKPVFLHALIKWCIIYFDINVILGFLCKLHIVSRWAMLDEQTGREMFRKLVDEVRGTFRGFGAGKETENNNNKNIRI